MGPYKLLDVVVLSVVSHDDRETVRGIAYTGNRLECFLEDGYSFVVGWNHDEHMRYLTGFL
jgi:hypothetical protein